MPRRWFNDGAWRHIFGDRRHVISSALPRSELRFAFGGDAGNVACYDGDGVEVWQNSLANTLGVLYLGFDPDLELILGAPNGSDYTYAFNAADGTKKWQSGSPNNYSHFVRASGKAYCINVHGDDLIRLDMTDGSELERMRDDLDNGPDGMMTTPDGDRLVVAETLNAGKLISYALDGTDRTGVYGSSNDMAPHPDRTYVALAHGSSVEAVEVASWTQYWVTSFPDASKCYAAWSPYGDHVYVARRGTVAGVACLDAADGSVVWDRTDYGTDLQDMDVAIDHSLLVTQAYQGTTGYLLDPANGDIVQQISLPHTAMHATEGPFLTAGRSSG